MRKQAYRFRTEKALNMGIVTGLSDIYQHMLISTGKRRKCGVFSLYLHIFF